MDVSSITLQPSQSPQPLGEPSLKFCLNAETQAIFLMRQVEEVVSLPRHRLTPIPNMPASVLGLMYRRSRVIWIVDLAALLGMSSLGLKSQHLDLVIIHGGAMRLALAVQRVDTMFWLPPQDVQPPPSHAKPALLAYLRGCILQNQEILWVLDTDAIAQSSNLHLTN